MFNSSRFYRTNPSRPCPICGDTSGKCANPNEEVVLCMTETEHEPKTRINNYYYSKKTTNGLWGIWYIKGEGSEKYTQEQIEMFERRKQLQEQKQREFYRGGLTEKERHQNFTLIIRSLGLSDKHRQYLKKERRLSDRQINSTGYATIRRYSELPPEVSLNIPGVYLGKYGFPTIGSPFAEGIFIPCRNKEGLIIGYQILRDERDKGAKYIWARTNGKNGKPDVVSNLQNGELPVNYRMNPGNNYETLYLVDSVFKANIVFSVWGVDVLGCAGSTFLSSQDQCSEIIKQYKNIVICPDGGDIVNPQVMLRTEKIEKWITEINTKPQYAWWHQMSKQDKDIDELDKWDFSLISWEDYAGLSPVRTEHVKPLRKQEETAPITEEELREAGYYAEEDFFEALEEKEFSEFQEFLINEANRHTKDKEQYSIPDLQPEQITYHPNAPLPLVYDYPAGHLLQLIIPSKYKFCRAQIFTQLKENGWKFVIDNSQTGSGKTHTVPELKEVLYVDINYKNPSVEEIKEFPYIHPRSYFGTYSVNGKIIIDPDEEIREQAAQPGCVSKGIYKIKSRNCILKPAFHSLQNKGYNVEGTDLICAKCPNKKACNIPQKDGNNLFKAQRRADFADIKEKKQGRFFYAQLSAQQYVENFPNYALVWEEAASTSSVDQINFFDTNLHKAISDLATYEIDKPHLAETEPLSPVARAWAVKVFKVLLDLLKPQTGKEVSGANRYFGLQHEQIIEKLPLVPEELTTKDFVAIFNAIGEDIESLIPDLSEVKVSEVNGDDSWESRRQSRVFEKEMKQEITQKMYQDLDKVSPNIFKVLATLIQLKEQKSPVNTVFSIDPLKNGKYTEWVFSLSTFNSAQRALARNAKQNIFLNATASVQQIKGHFGLKPEDSVIAVQTEKEELNNVQIFNVNTRGIKSNDWSKKARERVKALIATIKNDHPDQTFAVICPKKWCGELGTPYYYGNHDRGSNELKDFDNLIFVGTPYINLSQAKVDYNLTYGKDSDFTFEQYYAHLVKEARLQGTGRHRGQWQKEKTLRQFFICTDEDFSYFNDLGMTVKDMFAEDITVNAGNKASLEAIRLSVINLFRQGVDKITQVKVGEILNVSKQAISSAIKQSGFTQGWRAFVKSQVTLYNLYKGVVDKSPSERRKSIYQINNENTSAFDCPIRIALKENPLSLFNECIKHISELGLFRFLEFLAGITTYSVASCVLWLLAPAFDFNFNFDMFRRR